MGYAELQTLHDAELFVRKSDLQATTWDDIAGLESVKQALQETAILPLLRPDFFTGLRKPQNILLLGPPGTGKTMLVRAVAKESDSHLFVCSASAVTSKWMGASEKLVRTLFKVARQYAPSIIFLDEVDALLSRRKSDGAGGEHEASRRLKTEFMVQMEGITNTADSSSKQVLVLACTNCPWDVDSAVLRRFPRRILVPLPDRVARIGLLQHLLRKAGKHQLSARDSTTLATKLEGFRVPTFAPLPRKPPLVRCAPCRATRMPWRPFARYRPTIFDRSNCAILKRLCGKPPRVSVPHNFGTMKRGNTNKGWFPKSRLFDRVRGRVRKQRWRHRAITQLYI